MEKAMRRIKGFASRWRLGSSQSSLVDIAGQSKLSKVERELDLLEQYARDTGLFRHPEMIEFRIGRLVSRWRLGGR
jgi:hypothetical protein